MAATLASADLVWEIVRNNNSYVVKRKASGGVQLSRDPLNLTNKHCRKYAGFVNDKAIGIAPNEKGGVKVISKKASNYSKPSAVTEVVFHGGKSARKIYRAVANQTAKFGYRPDLRDVAVQRVSALRRSQRDPKADRVRKPRGKKAQKATTGEK